MALALDGHATGKWTSGSSFTVTLTTTSPNDVICIGVLTKSGILQTVSSISSTNTTGWTKRKQLTVNSNNSVELWVGTANAALTNEVITINLSAAPQNAAGANAWGVSGANTGAINDQNASLPATATGSSSTPTVTGVSTSNANDMIIAVEGSPDGTTTQSAGSGFTLIDTQSPGGGSSTLANEYKVVSTTQSSISVAFGASQSSHWGMIVDAIQAAGSGLPPGMQSLDLTPRNPQGSPNFTSLHRTWAFSFPLELIGKDVLPFGRMSFDLPPRPAEPNPRRGWQWWYQLELIGKDQLPIGEQVYDLAPRPAEQSPRRSWTWSYLLDLIGQDQLPVGVQIYDLVSGQKPPRQPDLRTWTWQYNPNLIGQDQLPIGVQVYDLAPAQKPPRQPDLRTWVWSYNLNLIGQDQLPTGAIVYDLPPRSAEPSPRRSWTWSYNVNLISQDVLPFNQYDWPLPKYKFRIEQTSVWNQTPMQGQDTLPFNQYDWPLPTPKARMPELRSWTWPQVYIFPPPPLPFNQYDWPLPPKGPPRLDQFYAYRSQFLTPALGASYFLLQPHVVNNVYLEQWTIATEGLELPYGWIPTLAVDPLNTAAVVAFYAAGPRPSNPEAFTWNYQNWLHLTAKRSQSIQPSNTHWVQVSPGMYQLTGLGAGLPPVGV